jgi:hypothetical protein
LVLPKAAEIIGFLWIRGMPLVPFADINLTSRLLFVLV